MSARSVAVLVPSFDEEALGPTLAALAQQARPGCRITAYVVDDGSTRPVALGDLPAPSPHFSIVLARHPINRGQGAALETARRLALADPAHDAFLTFDADGQHPADALPAFLEALGAGADVAFGNRFGGGSAVPRARSLLLRVASAFERWLTGLSLGDAHNGLRAFTRRAMEAVRIEQDRMAHATEIKQRVARAGLRVAEVPVTMTYSAESLGKGQSSLEAALVMRDIVYGFLFGER